MTEGKKNAIYWTENWFFWSGFEILTVVVLGLFYSTRRFCKLSVNLDYYLFYIVIELSFSVDSSRARRRIAVL